MLRLPSLAVVLVPTALVTAAAAGCASSSSGSHPSGGDARRRPTGSDASAADAPASDTSVPASDGSSPGTDAGADGSSAVDAAADGPCVPNLKCKPTPPDSGDYYADCVTQVNAFRACVCQPPLARWDAGESCADQEAQYDDTADAAHLGFEANLCKPEGNGECECPAWGSEESIISGCLQEMFDEGPPEGGYNHFSIMTSKTATMVACGIYTDAKGKVWALQNYQE